MDPDALPESFARRVTAIDHRAAYFQAHFALRGLPEYRAPYEALNESQFGRNVTFFGTAEQMQRDFEGCVRGEVPVSPSFNLQIPSLDDPSLARRACMRRAASRSTCPIGADRESQGRLRDEMAQRMVDKIASVAPNFPDLIERQLNYPAYTYELMFGCTGGDFTHGLLQPEFMGPFRPGPRGWPDNPVPIDGLYLCGAGCHGGPGVTFIPGYNCGYAVLEGTSDAVVAELALHEGQEHRHREREAREEAHHEEDPGPPQAAPAALDDRPQRQEHHVHDDVVLGRRVGGPVREQHLGVVDVVRPVAVEVRVADVEVPAQ